ncbi:MAG TPA: hypothetical protein VFU68_00475 [Terracidiphilus sp.]|nr:hypothetical protein [Terracidiphilus sp.]
MIPELRERYLSEFRPEKYRRLLALLNEQCGTQIHFRVAETPVFVREELLHSMADAGAALLEVLMGDSGYLAAARQAIPAGFCVAGETAHPHFLTADFALARDAGGMLVLHLVEIQAFPSVFGFQAQLCAGYREAFGLDPGLKQFLGGLEEVEYWELLSKTVLGRHAAEQVVLAEVEPLGQKTLPDFLVTAKRLGIAVVDIASLEPAGDELTYRDGAGRRIPIRRIYNRAIAEDLAARRVRLQFDLTRPWKVEWAGHPNWYFLVSKFSIPRLWRSEAGRRVVPPAVFLSDFLEGGGRAELEAAGVEPPAGPDAVFEELLLKPLFSFAGKGIEFAPTLARLETIPQKERGGYLLQKRMRFEQTIATPEGPTQAEFRILYLWPDGGQLTPALSLVRLGRGKMMGVDHNRSLAWVGASAAFFPGRNGEAQWR